MVMDGKTLQEYPVNAGVLQGSILGPTLLQLLICDLPDNSICNIADYADSATLYFKCDQAFNLWQQLVLTSDLKSGLRDIKNRVRNCFIDFNAGKTQLILFYQSGAIDVKIHGPVFEEI